MSQALDTRGIHTIGKRMHLFYIITFPQPLSQALMVVFASVDRHAVFHDRAVQVLLLMTEANAKLLQHVKAFKRCISRAARCCSSLTADDVQMVDAARFEEANIDLSFVIKSLKKPEMHAMFSQYLHPKAFVWLPFVPWPRQDVFYVCYILFDTC